MYVIASSWWSVAGRPLVSMARIYDKAAQKVLAYISFCCPASLAGSSFELMASASYYILIEFIRCFSVYYSISMP
jgi:hypothetical protein